MISPTEMYGGGGAATSAAAASAEDHSSVTSSKSGATGASRSVTSRSVATGMSGSTVPASNISPTTNTNSNSAEGGLLGNQGGLDTNNGNNGTTTTGGGVGGGGGGATESFTGGKRSKSLRKTFHKIHKNKDKVVTQKEITVCIQTLDREKDDPERVLEILKDDLKPMLISYVNQQQGSGGGGGGNTPTSANTSTPTQEEKSSKDYKANSKKDPPIVDKNLGPVTVELLRHNGQNAALVEECAGVLYLLSILNPNFKKGVARLFQAMNKHPNNQAILEDSALAIQNVVNANPDSHIRIAPSLPILWNAMARYPDNSMLVGAALNILEDLAFNPEMLNERCMTESIPAVLKVLENNPATATSESNPDNNNKTKIQACRILAELSYESPQNQQTIGFNLSYLLACCKESSNNTIATSKSDHQALQDRGIFVGSQGKTPIDPVLQATAMEVLANVAGHIPSHKNFVNRRAIPQIIKLLCSPNNTITSADCRVQACRAIANLTIPQIEQVASLRRTAGPTVIESGGIPAILTAMRQNLENVPLQTQACVVIQNLCLTAQKQNADEIMGEIIGAGGIPTVVSAIRQHSIREELQIQANGALYYMCYDKETIQQLTGCTDSESEFPLKEGEDPGLGFESAISGMGGSFGGSSDDDDDNGPTSSNNNNNGNTAGSGGGLSAIVRGMAFHSSTSAVQLSGLKVLSRLSLPEDFELLLSEGGLDVLLTTLHNFCDDPEICVWTCEILKNFTRPVSGQTRDLQRAVASKEGIPILLTSMRKHMADSKFQDAALACVRNLVLHPSNRPLVDEGGISTILVTMTVNSTHAAIQAYGCDALGRLAVDCSERIRYTIDVERGMQVALQAMKDHPTHPGVQDRVVFFLINMTEPKDNENEGGDTNSTCSTSSKLALESLQQLKPLPMLKDARQRMPPKGQERLEVLIARLQKSGGNGGGGNGGGEGGGGGGPGIKLMGLFGRNKQQATK